MWSRRQSKRAIITSSYRKIASGFITMWGQINVLTLKNESGLPHATYVCQRRTLYQTFTFTQHCQHKNTHQNLLETKLSCGTWGRVPRIRGRCGTVTRAWLKFNRREIWAIYAEYINCLWREQAVNTSSSDLATHHQWNRVFRLEFRVFKLDRPSLLGFSDSILEFSDSILEAQ